MGRQLYLALGLLCVALGVVGAFVPLLPTTIFLILAAFCFSRSSARMEAWLMAHPRFGATITAWQRERAISLGSKIAACAGMALGFALLHFVTRPAPIWELAAALFLLACAAYVVTRPHPKTDG